MIAIALMTILSAGPDDEAARLFTEARAAMKVNAWDLACPKLEASRRLKPTLGTLLNLGVCLQNQQKPGSAFEAFTQAQALARSASDEARATYAARQVELLRPKVAWLTLTPLKDPRPHTRIVVVGAVELEASPSPVTVPVDPGMTTVELTAEGHAPKTLRIDLAAGANGTLELPALEPLTPDVPVAPPPVVLTPEPAPPSRPLAVSEPMERVPSHRSAFIAGLIVSGLVLIASCVGFVWSRSTADQATLQQTTGMLVITRSQYDTAATLHPLTFGGMLGGLAGSIAFGALLAGERHGD